jgi:hypothetical protein
VGNFPKQNESSGIKKKEIDLEKQQSAPYFYLLNDLVPGAKCLHQLLMAHFTDHNTTYILNMKLRTVKKLPT